MRFKFSPRKTIEAAGLLLKSNGGKMNYMKLIKLLYLADRQSFGEYGCPITGDKYISMEYGPVLSSVRDMITIPKEMYREGNEWHNYFTEPESYAISLRDEQPAIEDLSEADVEILNAVFDSYGAFDQFKLVDITHKICGEWKNPKNRDAAAIPIMIEDILHEVGKTDDEISEIRDELIAQNHLETVFG